MYADHEALLSLMNHPHQSGKLAYWGLALQELDLMIHYRPGKLNQPTNSLSRGSGYALNGELQANVAPMQMDQDRQVIDKHLSSAKDREKTPEKHLALAKDREETLENHLVSVEDIETALCK